MTLAPLDGVPASLPRRAGAYLVDSLFLSLVSWLVTFPILGLIYFLEKARAPHVAQFGGWLATQDALWVEILNLIVYVAVALVLTAEWLYRWGNSPGKWLFRIWVVPSEHLAPLTRRQAWIRTAAMSLSYLTAGVGFLMAAFHPRRMALHDWVAKTWSVQRRRPGLSI
jgi:uncharacterized RDD family membrane protein YckC